MIGRTLGHYSILEELGRGGMGEVYRARDEVLGRDVAIKVLPEAFIQDPERLARFEREAKVLASLNHPHIGAIYGLEQDDGQRFLVLELVEGETLGEHLVLDPMPVEEAVPVAIQIAQALEAAHEKGVVHRDLKPANIKITPDGEVKVLDFGLAKPTEAVFQGDLTESPTLTYAPTGVGVILGTAAYMSPEQVRGQEVDKRSDIWAFGVVLWEMVTGKKLFEGNTVSDVLASTLMREPDWEGLPPDLPATVIRVLRRCLVQDAKERLHDIADARIELGEAFEEPAAPPHLVAQPESLWLRIVPWLLVPLALAAGWLARPELGSEPPPTVRFEVRVPGGEQVMHLFRHGSALSPDGRELAFVSGSFAEDWTPKHQLYLQRFDQWHARPVKGTEKGYQPIFSPDGQWLAFITTDPPRLRKVSIDGGQTQTLCECDATFGASWGPQGMIVFAAERGPLQQVSSVGGEPVPLTELLEDKGESGHRLPHFLPDGSAVIFTSVYAYRDWDLAQITAYSLASGERRLLIQGGSDGRHVDSGHLVFAREGKLLTVGFDPVKLETHGPVTPVLEGINHSIHTGNSAWRTGVANLTVSATGTVAYLKGSVFPEIRTTFVLVDRQGEEVAISGLEQREYLAGRISPDGRRLLLTTNYPPANVWHFDLDRESLSRETFEGRPSFAIWGPGPDEFTFDSYQDGRWSVYKKVIGSGPGARQELLSDVREFRVGSWSPDGRYLALTSLKRPNSPSTNDIWILSADGTLAPFLESEFWEAYPDFSPDGRWMAYSSSESGRSEVFVRPFPGPGPAVQISTNGGGAGAWSRDGRGIYYRSDDGFMAVEVDVSGDRFLTDKSMILFADTYGGSSPARSWDTTPDGRLLLKLFPDASEIQSALAESYPDRIQVVQNWAEELRQKIPANR